MAFILQFKNTEKNELELVQFLGSPKAMYKKKKVEKYIIRKTVS